MKSLKALIATLTMGFLMGMTAVHAGEEVTEIERMVSAGVSEPVITAYIDNAGRQYELTSDDIIRLERENVSDAVILEMINHGKIVENTDTAQPSLSPAFVRSLRSRRSGLRSISR